MKTTMKLSLVLLVIISACSPKINFIGNQHAPTQSVDLFFDAKDIEKEYKVMGFMQNEGREFANNPEKIKAALIEEAKRRGADAILFGDGYSELVNSSDGLGFGDRNGKGDIFGMGTSWNNHVKVFKVKLIKYQ
ncbi:hypothetical protein [Roseivirga misakiensis]|uniref:Uncharacterized protein n=1 Tax=Roseivirga misakiensis TaxID=1563681 RepID=A0A1E5SY54_9BACT|nr:hypothetical protein [Roseivirga misakiensis]OEK04042.1 hypothetical protein BFP71_11140 [Roseivirga misakiensis]